MWSWSRLLLQLFGRPGYLLIDAYTLREIPSKIHMLYLIFRALSIESVIQHAQRQSARPTAVGAGHPATRDHVVHMQRLQIENHFRPSKVQIRTVSRLWTIHGSCIFPGRKRVDTTATPTPYSLLRNHETNMKPHSLEVSMPFGDLHNVEHWVKWAVTKPGWLI